MDIQMTNAKKAQLQPCRQTLKSPAFANNDTC